MTRLPANAYVVTDDLLIKQWYIPGVGCRHQLKRVGKDCPLTATERQAYAKGAVSAVKQIRTERNCSLAEALELLNKARGGSPLARTRLVRRSDVF